MGLETITREAVLSAIEEFDLLGRDAFFGRYGFGRSRDYFIKVGSHAYDSKAVLGAAHRFEHGRILESAEFHGGEKTVAARLRKLQFEVLGPVNRLRWHIDELLLSLDLYLRMRNVEEWTKTNRQVRELSEELRSLRIYPEAVRTTSGFCSVDSIRFRPNNFGYVDPDYDRPGMANGGTAVQQVWDMWSGRQTALIDEVAAIRRRRTVEVAPEEEVDDEEYAAAEGEVVCGESRRYKRDREVVQRKKDEALKRTGFLACEVCGFDSKTLFGVVGVIDVHHVVPLKTSGRTTTRTGDLALVCPTCHRVLHAHNPIITPAELRQSRNRRHPAEN